MFIFFIIWVGCLTIESLIRQVLLLFFCPQPVVQIANKGDKVTGVILEDGTEVNAKVVLSNATPKVTYLDLLPQVCWLQFCAEELLLCIGEDVIKFPFTVLWQLSCNKSNSVIYLLLYMHSLHTYTDIQSFQMSSLRHTWINPFTAMMSLQNGH